MPNLDVQTVLLRIQMLMLFKAMEQQPIKSLRV